MFFYLKNRRNMTLFLNVCGKERKFHFNILYSSLFHTCHGFPSHNSTSLTLNSIRPVISFPPLPTGKIRAKIQGNATWDIELGSYHHTAVPPFQRIVIPHTVCVCCLSLVESISIGLISQEIIQLGQLFCPVGTLQTPMNG